MKKNNIILFIILALIIFVVIFAGINLLSTEVENDKTDISDLEDQNTYDKDDVFDEREIAKIFENITVKGIVELKPKGYIYMFNGQHFGEYGLEMEEYTTTNISDKKQECIDYCTSEKYDTTYIQEGDILICTGDLIKYKDGTEGSTSFDTKDNPIIVLKRKDFETMKKEIINSEELVTATVADYYSTNGSIYLKYDILDREYKLPFALKFKITDEIKVNGNLERGKEVKIRYKDLSVSLNKLEIEAIDVIDN